jgi:hypothetical protein
MSDITTIRQKLATNIGTVTGLRTSAELIDNPSPPIALVNLDSVDYHQAFQNGTTIMNFTVSLIVGRSAERTMQRKLDAYLSPTGAQSVKAGIESNRSLDGACDDLVVSAASSIGSITINDQTYLAAEFQITVYA